MQGTHSATPSAPWPRGSRPRSPRRGRRARTTGHRWACEGCDDPRPRVDIEVETPELAETVETSWAEGQGRCSNREAVGTRPQAPDAGRDCGGGVEETACLLKRARPP